MLSLLSSSFFDDPPVPVVVFVRSVVICFNCWSFGCLYPASLNFHVSRIRMYHIILCERWSLSFLLCVQGVQDSVGLVLAWVKMLFDCFFGNRGNICLGI